jgi:hypothetical protein
MKPACHTGWYAANVAITNTSAKSQVRCVKLVLVTGDDPAVRRNGASSLGLGSGIAPILGPQAWAGKNTNGVCGPAPLNSGSKAVARMAATVFSAPLQITGP